MDEGVHCNEAWAEPGGTLTSSGKTAKITVGAPASALCEGTAATLVSSVTPAAALGEVETTYTYTITNDGTTDLTMSKVRDRLPVSDPANGGFAYVLGSATSSIPMPIPGTHTESNPTRQRIDWDFSPSHTITSGESVSMSFDATAAVLAGDYWNEVWVTFDELPTPLYTWPTGVVKVLSVIVTCSTDGETAAVSELWLGTDVNVLSQLDIIHAGCS